MSSLACLKSQFARTRMNTREGASLGLALSPTLKPAGEPPQSLAGTESPWKPRGLGRGGGGSGLGLLGDQRLRT